MRAYYTIVFRLRGVALPPESPDTNLGELAGGVEAWLASDFSSFAVRALERNAIGDELLTTFTGERGEGLTLDERVARRVESSVSKLRNVHRNGPFLLFRRESEVEEFECAAERSADGFDFGLDGGPHPSEVASAAQPLLNAVLGALWLELPAMTGVDKVLSAVTYARGDGRPFYPMRLELNATGEVTSPIPVGAIDRLGGTARHLVPNSNLESVFRLLQVALERRSDRFRAFLFAWTALEIFIRKVFAEYEGEFFGRLRSEANFARHVEWIAEVMDQKFNLVPMFSLIASELGVEEATDEVTEFKKVKRIRDDLVHRGDYDERELPVAAAIELLRKYLRLHVGRDRIGVGEAD